MNLLCCHFGVPLAIKQGRSYCTNKLDQACDIVCLSLIPSTICSLLNCISHWFDLAGNQTPNIPHAKPALYWFIPRYLILHETCTPVCIEWWVLPSYHTVGPDGMAEWVERTSPVLWDMGIWILWVWTDVESNQWLKNVCLSLPSQALGIIRRCKVSVGSVSWHCDWVGYQIMVLVA